MGRSGQRRAKMSHLARIGNAGGGGKPGCRNCLAQDRPSSEPAMRFSPPQCGSEGQCDAKPIGENVVKVLERLEDHLSAAFFSVPRSPHPPAVGDTSAGPSLAPLSSRLHGPLRSTSSPARRRCDAAKTRKGKPEWQSACPDLVRHRLQHGGRGDRRSGYVVMPSLLAAHRPRRCKSVARRS
jgi:hypothetical protein